MPPDIRNSTALYEDRNSIGMKIGVENLWNILTGENRRARDKPAQCHCVRREILATDRLRLGTAMRRYVYQNTITSEEGKTQQHATVRCLLLTSASTCFGHNYAHLQENKDRVTAFGVLLCFCWMWLVAVVGRCLVGCEH